MIRAISGNSHRITVGQGCGDCVIRRCWTMADDDVIRIPLRARDGSVRAWAIVDREDADLAELRWSVDREGYARRTTLGADTPSGHGVERLHRSVLARAIDRPLNRQEQCDHISGDRLDNRRVNLRVATLGQNAVNRTARGESLYLGVNRSRNNWRAQIVPLGSGRRGRQLFLGRFATEEDAARAYDRAAREYHGEYARLNFPDGGEA